MVQPALRLAASALKMRESGKPRLMKPPWDRGARCGANVGTPFRFPKTRVEEPSMVCALAVPVTEAKLVADAFAVRRGERNRGGRNGWNDHRRGQVRRQIAEGGKHDCDFRLEGQIARAIGLPIHARAHLRIALIDGAEADSQ